MRRRVLLLSLLAGVLPAAQAFAAEPGRPPVIAVVESALAEKWLERAGVPFLRRSRESLDTAPLPNVRLVILPLEAVTTPAAVRHVSDFASAGGRVLAVYWGTLSAPDSFPIYQLSNMLGVRPVGWAEDPPQPLIIEETGAGAAPSMGRSVSLPRMPATVVEPFPGTRAVARWSGGPGAVFQREGVLYVAANLLRPSNDRLEARELFFWVLQRAAPDFGPGFQARDRIATAGEVCASMTAAVTPEQAGSVASLAEDALAALTEARTHLAQGRALRATASADRARATAKQVLDQLRGSAPR
jgi:hypothetical protein